MRNVFTDVLLEAREADDRVFVLDGDCARSTQTFRFGQRFPQSFLNAGIAEQNMVGMAAGLAHAGLRPVVSGFASIVVGRAAEQIILSVAWPGLPVTIAGHYAGMSGAREGAPHHAISDLAFMRAIPGMRIWIPADDTDVRILSPLALGGDGPAYIRLCRDTVTPLKSDVRLGDGVRLWPRTEADITMVACGVAVGETLSAAAALADDGLQVRVVGVLWLKPLPEAALRTAIGNPRLVVTVEEHSIVGGLGSAIAELLAERGGPPVVRLGVADRFTETGTYRQLLERYGVASRPIATSVRDAYARLAAS